MSVCLRVWNAGKNTPFRSFCCFFSFSAPRMENGNTQTVMNRFKLATAKYLSELKPPKKVISMTSNIITVEHSTFHEIDSLVWLEFVKPFVSTENQLENVNVNEMSTCSLRKIEAEFSAQEELFRSRCAAVCAVAFISGSLHFRYFFLHFNPKTQWKWNREKNEYKSVDFCRFFFFSRFNSSSNGPFNKILSFSPLQSTDRERAKRGIKWKEIHNKRKAKRALFWFARLWIKNASKKAEKIEFNDLSVLCECVEYKKSTQ